MVRGRPLGVRGEARRSQLFAAKRRVVVKARVVRHQRRAFRSAPLSAHVAYLERDGITRDGEKGCMFGTTGNRIDAMAFARRGLSDRHHFRFVATPEDIDLRPVNPGVDDPEARRLAIGRLQKLERIGLAGLLGQANG